MEKLPHTFRAGKYRCHTAQALIVCEEIADQRTRKRADQKLGGFGRVITMQLHGGNIYKIAFPRAVGSAVRRQIQLAVDHIADLGEPMNVLNIVIVRPLEILLERSVGNKVFALNLHGSLRKYHILSAIIPYLSDFVKIRMV